MACCSLGGFAGLRPGPAKPGPGLLRAEDPRPEDLPTHPYENHTNRGSALPHTEGSVDCGPRVVSHADPAYRLAFEWRSGFERAKPSFADHRVADSPQAACLRRRPPDRAGPDHVGERLRDG
jgi:hypothetical protein